MSNGPDQAMAWDGSTYVLIKGTCDALKPDQMSPEQVAEQAIARLSFTTPDVGIGPNPDTNGLGMLVVGYNVWFFPEGGSMKPVTVSDSVGGHNVSLSIRVKEVLWDVGDGTTLRCEGGGSRRPGGLTSDTPSPDCGHKCQKRGDHTVIGLTTWQVDWTASGASGSQTVTLSNSRPLKIGELQSVNR
ncbi:MAG: hypothetical protein L0G99_01035 [Propionibacteriales bacterium]|nr:hypothetical protein [Propionibacteriales bacterium]